MNTHNVYKTWTIKLISCKFPLFPFFFLIHIIHKFVHHCFALWKLNQMAISGSPAGSRSGSPVSDPGSPGSDVHHSPMQQGSISPTHSGASGSPPGSRSASPHSEREGSHSRSPSPDKPGSAAQSPGSHHSQGSPGSHHSGWDSLASLMFNCEYYSNLA